MKTERNFLVLCENFIVDEKGRASLINLYDIVFSESFPALHPTLKYVFNVRIFDSGNNKSLTFSFLLEDKSGKKLFEVKDSSAPVHPKMKIQNVGGVIDVINTQFDKPQQYVAKLIIDEKTIAEHFLETRLVPQPEK